MTIEDIHEEVFKFLLKKREADPSLRYNLRFHDDKKMKLGHWFHGETDQKAYVTFWDTVTDVFPTIYFSISNEGETQLCIDERRKEGQFGLWGEMSTTLGLTQVTAIKWMKSYPIKKSYLENLDDFINIERPYINSFLAIKRRTEDYLPIPEGKFLRNLAKVETIRGNRLDNVEKENQNSNNFAEFDTFIEQKLTVNCLQFTNINAFKSLNINFDKRVTCFLGGNGSGKTTILRGLALGLVGSEGFKANELNLLSIKEAKKQVVLQKEGFIDVLYTFKNESLKNSIEFQSDKEAVEANFKPDNGYTLRDETDGKYLKALIVGFSQQTESDNNLYANGGFNPKLSDVKALISNDLENRCEEFMRWLEDLIRADAQEDRAHNKVIIDEIFSIVGSVTGGKIELTSEFNTFIKTPVNPYGVPMSLLSQGYRNVFAWLGFFMKRMVEYRDSLPFDVPSFTELPAICLIDEIDTYLHPDWQYTILSGLVEHFPNVQFFITSHSPLVLTTVPSEIIAIFKLKIEDGQVFAREEEYVNLYGADANRATASITSISNDRKPDFEVSFKTLDSKIENNELEEAKTFMETDEKLSKMDSQGDLRILSAKRMIRTKELLNKAKKEGSL